MTLKGRLGKLGHFTWLKKVAVKRAKTSHGKSRSVSDEEKNMKR
jgi:hypothetical protein